MGAWDTGSFGNDDAADWAWQFDEMEGLQLIDDTLEKVRDESSNGYIEAPTGSEAIAACEVIARLKGFGSPPTAYSEAADKWVAAHPNKPSLEILAKANSALDLITSDNSELRELWEDSESYSEWEASIADLRKRMNS